MDPRHRLYLSIGKEVVYIDNCNIPQHCIDGIRFLYMQWKKKKPGVIINDASKKSRDLQIVMFIHSIHRLLDKPVLVLCSKRTQTVWLESFQTLTDLGDDVVIETTRPVKKKVIINPMINLPSFSSHEWSIVVVADCEDTRPVLRHHFRSAFKIYNTAVAMKENLGTFSSIHTWLTQVKPKSKNAKETFNECEFVADRSNIKDVIDKAVRLDAFMEDVVLRRKGLDCNIEEAEEPILSAKELSKKNKLATKRKIKKPTVTDNQNEDNGMLSIPKMPKTTKNYSEDIISDAPETSDALNTPNVDGSKMNLNELAKEFNMDTINSQSAEMKLVFEADSMTDGDKIYEMDTLVDEDCCNDMGDTDKEIPDIIMNCDVNEIKPDRFLDKEPEIKLYEVLNNRDDQTKWKLTNIVIQNTEDSQASSNTSIIDDSHDDKAINQSAMSICNINPSELEVKISNNNEIITDKIDSVLEDKSNLDEIVSETIIPIDIEKFNNDQVLSKDEIKPILNDENVIDSNMKSENEISVLNTQDEANMEVDIINNTVKIDDTPSAVNKRDHNDLDYKSDQAKKEVIKRFKGSLLDSLF